VRCDRRDSFVISQLVTAVASVVVAAEKRVVQEAMVAAETASVRTSRALMLKGQSSMSPMRRKQTVQQGRAHELVLATLVLCSLVLAWALFFMLYPGEDKTFVEAVYFGVVTMSTVGFGDVLPATQGGRLFASVGMVVGAAAFAVVVAKFTWFSYHYFQDLSITEIDKYSLYRMLEFKRRGAAVNEAAMREYTRRLAEAFNQNGFDGLHATFNSRISRNDFIVFMLMDMDLIDGEVLEMLNEHFDKLDATGEGYIDDEDIAAARRRGQ